jgi:phage gp36-like protein
MAGDYCTINDILVLLAQDAQARLTTEPGRPWLLGVATPTPQTEWETPFIGSSSLAGYFNGVLQTGTVLLVGAGTDGTDKIGFSAAPASGVGVTVVADAAAINSAIVALAITKASREIDQYIAGRYATPVTDPVTLTQLWGVAIEGVRWGLRKRRNIEEWSPIVEDRKQMLAWLMAVAQGKIPLAASAKEQVVTVPEAPAFSGSGERSVFDAPFVGPNLPSLYGY